MIGVLELVGEKGRGPVLSREQLGGLTCLRAAVPAPPRLREGRLRRRVEQAGALLRRAGIRRVLTAAEFPYWAELRESGLRPVEVEGLCQAMAVPLTLAALARRGVPLTGAAVLLSGPSASRSLLRAAEGLCPRVRWLTVDVPGEGEEVAAWLWARFGAAAVSPGTGRRADVALRFGPGGAEGGVTLELYGKRPELAGLSLAAPPQVEGAGLETLPLLALLWEAGYLDLREIRITSA